MTLSFLLMHQKSLHRVESVSNTVIPILIPKFKFKKKISRIENIGK